MKYFKVEMFIETKDDVNGYNINGHVRELLEDSDAIVNCDIDNSREVDVAETPY